MYFYKGMWGGGVGWRVVKEEEEEGKRKVKVTSFCYRDEHLVCCRPGATHT